MSKKDEPSLRQTVLFATTVAALGVSLGVPMKEGLAASLDVGTSSASAAGHAANPSNKISLNHPAAMPETIGVAAAPGMLKVAEIAPPSLDSTVVGNLQTEVGDFRLATPNPNTLRVLGIAYQALSDNSLAERIFREPDVVAMQYNLSNHAKLVLRHMDREQFQTARIDAMREVLVHQLGDIQGFADVLTAETIVGRAILAAVGRSYLDAMDAHQCCPWGGSIQLGINSDPAYYNPVFQTTPGTIASIDPVQ
jgi:hypothetical protein